MFLAFASFLIGLWMIGLIIGTTVGGFIHLLIVLAVLVMLFGHFRQHGTPFRS